LWPGTEIFSEITTKILQRQPFRLRWPSVSLACNRTLVKWPDERLRDVILARALLKRKEAQGQ
jgi:hypothetical protein